MRKIFLIGLILFFYFKTNACDVCGGGAGGSVFGIIPQFTKGFLALHYQTQTFNHPTNPPNMNGNSIVKRDRYQLLEFRGRHYLDPKSRWQLQYALPYRSNTREESLMTTHISGLGDITLTGNYAAINTGDSQNVRWKNTLLVGVITAMPTGKYQQRGQNKTMMPPEFQTGTGAWAAGPMINYTTRIDKLGFNLFANYLFRGTNELGYHFGNGLNSNLSAFYWFDAGKAVIMPQIGASVIRNSADSEFEALVTTTDDNIIFFNSGVDVYFSGFFMNLFYNIAGPSVQYSNQPTPANFGGIRLGVFLTGTKSKPETSPITPSNFPPTEL